MLLVAACTLSAPDCRAAAPDAAPVGIVTCSDGVVDGDEACDLGSENGSATSCCASDCQLRASGETCRPSTGVCDAPEQCWGTGATCPADSKVASGAVCRVAVGSCDVAEQCDGVTDDCPADDPAPDGTPCDDADTCTRTDACTAGACVGTSALACDPCEVCDPTGGCVLPTAPGCRIAPPRNSSITIKRIVGQPTRSFFAWKWRATDPVALADFGDPMTSSDYALCVIDQRDGRLTLRMSVTAPAAGTCAGNPCWRTRALGLAYKDKEATPDGILSVGLKAGTPAKLKAKGKGANLVMPYPELVPPVVVRMIRSDGPDCWEAGYASPIADLPTLFKARND
jgi:hypothetical protein